MKSCILHTTPLTHNRWKKYTPEEKAEYQAKLHTAIEEKNNVKIATEDLYGIVYYFSKIRNPLDADNLSKPIWDSIELLYNDDKQIKLRIAGIIYMPKEEISYTLFNPEFVQENLVDDLAEAIANRKNTIYIECGPLKQDMYLFNLQKVYES